MAKILFLGNLGVVEIVLIGGIGTGGRTFRRSFRTPHTKMRPGRLHGNALVSIRH